MSDSWNGLIGINPRATMKCFCALVLAFSACASGMIFKPDLIYPFSALPPAYPAEGFPRGVDDAVYGTTPSHYFAGPMGLLYVAVSATHGRVCTASAINKRWVFTTAHCVRGIDRRVGIVYMPNHDERKYEIYGTKIVLSHKNFSANSASDIALINLRRFYRHLPFLHARIHGSVEYAIRRGSVWTSVGFGTPTEPNNPMLTASFQETGQKLCRPGDGRTAVLCTTAFNGTTSGVGSADGGAVLIGKQNPFHRRLARIGLYIGSSSNDASDVNRINYYLIIASFKSAMQAGRFGRYDEWNVL